MPPISVAIPVHNASEYLPRAIRSVLEQDLQDFEIIIVDDASSDDTLRTALAHSTDPRIRVHRHFSNHGVAAGLNFALRLARGEMLLHLDADDWLEPSALSAVVRRASSPDQPAAVYGRAIVHTEGKPTIYSELFRATRPIDHLVSARVPVVPRAYRTSILRELDGWTRRDAYEGRFFEDRLTLWRVASTHHVAAMDEAVYNIDVRDGSLTRRNQLAPALAKFNILCGVAADLGLGLDDTALLEGGFLKASFHQLPETFEDWSVVSVYEGGCRDSARRALRSWEQSGVASRRELVLVDTSASGEAQGLRDEWPLTYIGARGVSVTEALNIGAAHTTYRYLMFCSCLDVVPRRVLEMHERHHRSDSRPTVVASRLFGRLSVPVWSPSHSSALDARLADIAACGVACEPLLAERDADAWTSAKAVGFVGGGTGIERPVIQTCLAIWKNAVRPQHVLSQDGLSVPREAFTAAGGFDVRCSPTAAGADLATRLSLSGARVVFCPEAEPYFQLSGPIQRYRDNAIPNTNWLAGTPNAVAAG